MFVAFYLFATSLLYSVFFFFFFNDTATTEIYTLSLHDALPISSTTIGSVIVEIPAGIQIVAGISNWNGIINVPQVKIGRAHV